ncbi:MAG: hypothetical protein BWX58_00156 [Deltaproteobacteria bacterium ADurb.Bin026]|nr:MAG: hypothetical protein BWX58_00156 [Deltaproteobacteria bacterium ADurb.Bin026]
MTRNPKIPHYIRDMDFSLRKISHPAHAGIRNDRKEGRNDKKWRLFKALDYEKRSSTHGPPWRGIPEIDSLTHRLIKGLKRVGTKNPT